MNLYNIERTFYILKEENEIEKNDMNIDSQQEWSPAVGFQWIVMDLSRDHGTAEARPPVSKAGQICIKYIYIIGPSSRRKKLEERKRRVFQLGTCQAGESTKDSLRRPRIRCIV